MDFTDSASSKPDSSVAHVTSTLLAPMPPAIRRSAPDKSISPGSAGRAPSMPRCRSSAAIARATFSETCSEYRRFSAREAVSDGFTSRVRSAAARKLSDAAMTPVNLLNGSRVGQTSPGVRSATGQPACGECSESDATVFCLLLPQPRPNFRCADVAPMWGGDAEGRWPRRRSHRTMAPVNGLLPWAPISTDRHRTRARRAPHPGASCCST